MALSSRGVDPQESGECDALIEELLLRGGYLETYPPPDPCLPRALYRLTDPGIAPAEEGSR